MARIFQSETVLAFVIGAFFITSEPMYFSKSVTEPRALGCLENHPIRFFHRKYNLIENSLTT